MLKASLLPFKMLFVLAGACLAWIGLLSVAFLVFTGLGMSTGWMVAGALFFAMVVWTLVMSGEFRNASMERSAAGRTDCEIDPVTGPLPRRAKSRAYRLRYNRTSARRLPGYAKRG